MLCNAASFVVFIEDKMNMVKHLTSIMEHPSTYKNIPPKEIQNAIWGACFDYEDFDTVIDDMTVRDRIYECWQILHEVLKQNPEHHMQWIINNQPDIEV